MAQVLRVGDVEVTLIDDIVAPVPLTLDHVFPGSTPEDWAPLRERFPHAFAGDSPRAWFRCYLVRSRGRTILVDSGVGPDGIAFANWMGAGGSLPDELSRLDVAPEQIDVVFHTHLHADHAGWNLAEAEGGYRPTFPRARYVASELDWERLQQPDAEQILPWPYVGRCVRPLADLGVLELVGDGHALTEDLTTVHTPGHMPGHMALLISSRGERALIVGDNLVSPLQIANPDQSFIFDMDPAAASRTRRSLLERIEREEMTVLPTHFPAPGHGRLGRENGQLRWSPG